MASLRYGVYLLPAQPLAAAVAAVHAGSRASTGCTRPRASCRTSR